MRILNIFLLTIAGCAGNLPSTDEFYHRLSNKPYITEKVIDSDNKIINVNNPLDLAINATVDCDEQRDNKLIHIDALGKTSFKVSTKLIAASCVIEHWAVD